MNEGVLKSDGNELPINEYFEYLGPFEDGDIHSDMAHRIKFGALKCEGPIGILCDLNV